MPDSKLIEEARARFRQARDAMQKQRERETKALRFQVPAYQWDDDARGARQADTIAGIQIPARPVLSIPKLDQPIQLVLNQEKAAHLGVQISALDEDADDDTAEVIQGLYRDIERRSRAGLARSWGFDRAVKCGTGVYRVNTKYCDEGGHPFDQDITIERVLYQDAVYFDPAAQEPDWCDGEYAFVGNFMRVSKIKRLYRKTKLADYEPHEFDELFKEFPEWIRDDGDEKAVLVVEYWRKAYTTRTWVILDDGSFSYEDEIPTGRKALKDARRRTIQQATVQWSVINPIEELTETQDWNGKYIPLIPVIGRELQPFDKERRWVGVIEPAMDAQKLFNYAASSAVELAALEPKAPYLMAEGQDEGHETEWQQSTIRNFPALHYKPILGPNGQPLGPPTRAQVDVGRLGPSMMLLQQADNFIQASTSTFDPSLGRLPTKDRSGVAIARLQEQSDAGNSHYLHNLATISMTYEAKVVLDLLPRIYDRPGRVARILDFEDNASTVILNAPFMTDEKGRPVPVNGNAQALQQQQQDVKTFDLRKGSYGVNVSIGKSWQTRLQQGGEEIGAILQSSPQLMPLIGPTYFKFRDFPGSTEIAELLKKMRAQQFPFLEQQDGNQPDAQQLQAQIQAMQQQLQMLQEQLQQAGQIIQTKQVETSAKAQVEQAKYTADVQLEQIKATLAERLKVLDNAGKLAVAEVQARMKGVQIDQEAEHEAIALAHEHAHEERMTALQPAPMPNNGDEGV